MGAKVFKRKYWMRFRGIVPESAEERIIGGDTYLIWFDEKGRKCQVRRTGKSQVYKLSILAESRYYTARYRTAGGRIVQRCTKCANKDAALMQLSEWLKEAEKIKSGLISEDQLIVSSYAQIGINRHICDFEAYMTSKRLNKNHVKVTASYLRRIFGQCNVKKVSDISRVRIEQHIRKQVNDCGMGLRTANGYITALSSFGTWLIRENRITANPFLRMQKFNESTDSRRPRRIFTQEELAKLFQAAEKRPLHDLLNKPTRAKNKEVRKRPELKPETIAAAQWSGVVHARLYKLAAYTGLRYAEIRSITLGQCHLSDDLPYLELKAENAKNRKAARIPVPIFFLADLKHYVAERQHRLAKHCIGFPGYFNDKPLFELPTSITKTFNKDLVHAGLATVEKREDRCDKFHKTNQRGESLDFHSLRHTFITNVSLSGATMVETAKAARHSDPRLTLKVYSHVDLQALSNAVNRLPQITGGEDETGLARVEPKIVVHKMRRIGGISRYSMESHDNKDAFSEKAGMPVNIEKKRIYRGKKNGGAVGDRTPDLLTASQALSQLSYGPEG